MRAPRSIERKKSGRPASTPSSAASASPRYANPLKRKKKKPAKNGSGRSKIITILGWLKSGLLPTAGKMAKLTLTAVGVIIALALVSTILVSGYLYVSNSDYFTVKKVTIAGLNHIGRDEVLTAAGLNKAPVNILSFDLSESEKALKSLPWLADAKISRLMPDAISIEVTEYQPKILVNLGKLYYMDERGVPFKELEPGTNPQLPIVSGFESDDLAAPAPSTSVALAEVFWLTEALTMRNDEFKFDDISEINYDYARGLTLFTKDGGIQVKIGVGAYEEKFKRLGRVMAHLKLQNQDAGISYINLEGSPRVTVRYDFQKTKPAG